jgi:formylglycine-generating enzyme required for sulfatase activity
MKQKIFISYSHNDKEWLTKIDPFLKGLKQKADFEIWSDENIMPSNKWDSEIKKALFEADAAILLVSQDFLVSDYINNIELPELLKFVKERGLRIFPIIISSFYIKDSPISEFQAINHSKPLDQLEKYEQNQILAKLAESIDELLTINQGGLQESWLEKFREQFEFVEGGQFIIGDNELFGKLHAFEEKEAEVNSFLLGRYVVTQSEWYTIMRTQPWIGEKNVKYGDNLPAVYINWYDTYDFIRLLNKRDSSFYYRLPTEMEWEFAARGGLKGTQKQTKFCFGNEMGLLNNYGWFDQNASLRGKSYAQPVGMCEPNQLNLYDMHGNIWEWLNDDIDGLRPLRGGGFNFHAEGASSAFRVVQKPEVKGEAAGFRLVRIAREAL